MADESEIGDAVADLLPRVRDQLAKNGVTGVDIVLTYDGTSDDSIVVTAGAPTSDAQVPGLEAVRVEGAEHGASVRFDTPPSDTGDAWIAIDANLEQRGQETTGVYRQTLTRDGGVVLQAPLRNLAQAD